MHIASGDRWAGAEAQLFTLVTQLASEQQLRVAVVLLNDGELASRLRAAGIEVSVFDESRLGFLALLRGIHRVLRERRPDLVHTHRQKENILGALCAWRLGIPSVRTVHGAPEFAPRGLTKRLLVAFDRWLGRHVQRRVIAVSEDLRDKLLAHYPAPRLRTIENGIDLEAVRATATPPATLDDAPPGMQHVGIAGRLDPVKRIDLVLAMAAELLRRAPQRWRFHVFGEGRLTADLRAQAEALGIAQAVRFHGHRSDIGACLAALDVLVMCSDHEGLPMTPLESIAVGTPVVAHAVGGLVPILEGGCGGTLVSDHSPRGYADAVERTLLAGRDALIARGRERLQHRYSAGANAAAVAAMYREVLRGNSANAGEE